MRRASMLVLFGLALFASATARAQNCVGFTDVLASDPFCPYVEWMKNRGITTGCTATTYCPADPVSRLAMAAFMNRLGRALAVEPLFVEMVTGAIPLTSGPPQMRCITADTAATNYPRAVTIVGTLSGLADANAVAWRGETYFSTDAGATWQIVGGFGGMRASSPPNQWSNTAFEMRLDLDPLMTYRFAVGISRDDILVTTGNLADGRCQITAAVGNRNGVASPYDAAIATRRGSTP